jgi:NDP-sugar pyrophosphorylase family protein
MKEKISITIDTGLIKKADSMINGISVRNRSQALESLLRKALSEESVDCAIILAGGDIRELKLGDTYKPIATIDGAPNMVNTVRNLKAAGVTKIVVAAGSLTDKIFELVGDGSEFGTNIIYVKDSDSGTAGAVKSASRHIGGTFFVVFADIYFDFDMSSMVSFHRSNKELATMAVSVTELKESMDSIKIIGNKITEFNYKVGKSRTHHVNAGIYLFEKDILEIMPGKGSLEKVLLPHLAREGKLSGFVFSGKWRHL